MAHWIRALVVVALLIAAAQPARAVETVPCRDVGGAETFNENFNFFLSVQLNEDQQITFRTTTVSGSPNGAQMWMTVNGSEVERVAIPGVITWSPPESGEWALILSTDSMDSAYTYLAEITCGRIPDASSGDNSGVVVGPPCANVFDARINNSLAYDCAAPVAVYVGSIDVYGIDPNTGEGIFLLRVEDSALAGNPPAANTLLTEAVNPATGQPVRLYRLTSDEIYLATAYADGKPYIVVWQNGSPDTLYHVAA